MRSKKLLIASACMLTLMAITNCLANCCPSSCWSKYFDFSYKEEFGPTFQYTRFKQGCLPFQAGMMIGPAATIDLQQKHCGFGWHIGFKGLYDIPHIASCNGFIIDAREYEVDNHFGYNFFNDDCCFALKPFTGFDFIYLRHQVVCNVLQNRYYQINVPFGVDFLYHLNDTVDWGLKLLYDLDVWTRLKISTPDMNSTSETKIKLKRGDRFALEMPVNANFNVCDWCCSVNFTFLFNWQKFESEECPQDLNIPVFEKWHVGSMLTFGVEF